LILLACCGPAAADQMTAEKLAKRVGQVFAGYNTFWVWIDQRFTFADGTVRAYRGRAYFKRDKMFRLNFGQPPFLVEGTDGDEYWIYDADKKLIEYTDLDEDAPLHPLLPVFAMGGRMVRALNRYFDVEELEEDVYTDPHTKEKAKVFRLVLKLKPEQLKELRKKADKELVPPDAEQKWTFLVDQEKWLPRHIEIDMGAEKRSFGLGVFHTNIPLHDRLFRRPPGIKAVEMKKSED
jgi:outer membrane lipoprotein-sorting protein